MTLWKFQNFNNELAMPAMYPATNYNQGEPVVIRQ